MGGDSQQLTGPDLKSGVFLKSLAESGKVLGHADGVPVLLVQSQGKYFAVGALCSHYGGNLNDGIITDTHAHCPWHHACFDLATGEATKAPALNPIPTWKTEVVGDKIFVREQNASQSEDIQIKSKEHFIIIGSGAAGHAAAEMLRRKGFSGSLTMLSADQDLPYDRPNLSKDYLAGTAPEEWMSLRDEAFYKSQGIELRLKTQVQAINVQEKSLSLSSGETLHFNKCLLTTGGTPHRLSLPGADSKHVYYLRSFADCRNLIDGLSNVKNIVIIGAGFIGLEAAAALRSRGLNVTVVAPDQVPLERVVGERIGHFIQSVHEKNGVTFKLGRKVVKIDAQAVTMDDGKQLQCDAVLAAIGIRPSQDLAAQAGLDCDKGVVVNEFLETSVKDIYAAGDVAQYPDRISGQNIRVEHWAVAQRQGQTAAMNMLGQQQPFTDVPFFWTQQFDLTLCCVGHSAGWNKAEIFGDPEKRDAAVALSKDDHIQAVLTIGRDTESLKIEQAFENSNQGAIRRILSST